LCPSELTEVVFARGHENILATHPSTLEITKERHVSRRGDCVVAVAADKGIEDLSQEFKQSMRRGANVTVLVIAGEMTERINAHGDPRLSLTHPTDMVIRKSTHISGRTLAIHADKAANDLSRKLVEKLKNPKQKVKIILMVRT
jgi:hypothetical protein